MSDTPKYAQPLVYDAATPVAVQQVKALIAIANSLRILADETSINSPITVAALILDGCTPDPEPTGQAS